MNRNAKIITSGILCAALLAGAVATGASAKKAPAPTAAPAAASEAAAAAAAPAAPAQPDDPDADRDETVYVFAKADGTTEKVVASDWIKGQEGGQYTKRNADETLPVAMTVSYTLDGQPITPGKLAGKSGRVNICYHFENRKTAEVETDGGQRTVNVPFAVLTGVILDNDVFSHVEVEGGKLVNDGDRMMVLGVSLPGLQNNLGVSTDKLDLPDQLRITADVQDFELMNTMTLVTNEVFRDLDGDGLDDFADLTEAADKLTDAMTQLMDGSVKLRDGLTTLQEKSGELSSGVTQLAEGASQLDEGAGTLDNGMATLQSGAGQLSEGLDTLSGNSAALNAGAGQVFDTLIGAANQQLEAKGLPTVTREDYGQVLNGIIDSLGEGAVRQQAETVARQKVTAAVEAKRGDVTAAVTEAVRQQVQAKAEEQAKPQAEAKAKQAVTVKVLAALGMTPEQYEQGVAAGAIPPEQQAQVEAAVEAQMATTEVQELIAQGMAAAIEPAVEAAMQSEEIQATIAQKTDEQVAALIEQNLASPEVQQQITDALAQASEGAAAISALKGQLDAYNQFYTGLATYTAGVDTASGAAAQLAAGAGELKGGTSALKEGTSALNSGVATMQTNLPTLLDGVNQLAEGGKTLADGLSEFNREGIQKLVDAVNGDLDSLITGLRATLDAARTYTGLADTATPDSCVKFIYRTEAID